METSPPEPQRRVLRAAVVVPSIGARSLGRCLEAIRGLDPGPETVRVVLSGPAPEPADLPSAVEVERVGGRLGFAAAVNAGLRGCPPTVEAVAVVNDDAEPAPTWLGRLAAALVADPGLAAVQGTITDQTGERVDGRGIALDRFGLPVQVDRGDPAGAEPAGPAPRLALSATAVLLRVEALRQAELAGGGAFDAAFGAYHEDLDLGLRLARLGWRAAWVDGAPCRHRGSTSGLAMRWRHPWWVLSNRWRALAGNLTPSALVGALPRLLRGEARAVRTLVRDNWRAVGVAPAVVVLLPLLVASGWRRATPGPRLDHWPEVRG